ncbi:MAG: hypothetical protein L0Y66_27215 [Myxococcaceae bacterium]|nr:hypothetical protein [Myxococcaceae bacterium]MCI0670795.1 hypothetical protein [Myxococcaceae bacterium]
MKRWLVAWLCAGLLPAAVLAQEQPQGPQPETPPAAPVEEAPGEQAAPASPAPQSGTTVATPTSGNASVQTPEQLAAQTGWSVMASVGSTVGHGTFIKPEQVAYVDLGVTVQPRFNFRGPGGLRLVASASASASFELTPPDSATGRRFDWSDLRFGLSSPALYELPVVGASVTPVLSLTVPATLRSWWGGSLGVLGAGVGVNRTFGAWILNYQLSGSRGFHRSLAIGPSAPSEGGDVRRDATGNPLDICRAGQQLCASAGLNTAWSVNQTVGVTWAPDPRWTGSLGVGLSHQWRYAVTSAPDEYTAPTLDEHGNPAVHTGMGRTDSLSVSLSGGYNLNDQLSLSFGVSDAGPPLSRDNKRLRFLFVEGAVASTTYSLSLSALY